MHKNQLQQLAQRSCFNLPSYACVRQGPDHAPRFKATVTFNGETFESPNFCNSVRHAEHTAAEAALNTLSRRGPTQPLTARIFDETGMCKNLLQETAQRAHVELPCYTTVRSGPGHLLVFTCTVELAGMSFTGASAKTKKEAEKNAATAAWASLKQLVTQGGSLMPSTESAANEEQEKIIIALATSIKDDISFRASRAQTPHLLHEALPAKYQPQAVGPVPTVSRIKASPFLELSVQVGTSMQGPCSSSDWMAMNLRADGSLGQRHPPGYRHLDALVRSGSSHHSSVSHGQDNSRRAATQATGFPGDLNVGDQISAHEVGTIAMSMQAKDYSVPIGPGKESVSALMLNEHEKVD